MDLFTARLFQPPPDLTPLPDLDLNPRVTDLRWTSGLPGGFLALEVGMRAAHERPVVGHIPDPIDVPPFAHVEVWQGLTLCWEGRVMEMQDAPGGVVGFTAEGYMSALSDDWSRSTSITSVTTGAALESVLASAAPLIRRGHSEQWVDPGVTHAGGLNEFYKRTPGEMVDQVTRQGSVVAAPVDFYILGRRTAYLLSRSAGADPDYWLPFDHRVSRRRNYRPVYGAVTVEYGDSATGTLTAESSDGTFADRYGLIRRLLIPAGNVSAGAATALRDTELARRQEPEITYTIAVGSDGLERLSGQPQPFYAILPGETVRVADDPTQAIVGVTVDANGRTATVELGYLSPALPKNHRRAEREATAQQRRMIAPNGGRTRA